MVRFRARCISEVSSRHDIIESLTHTQGETGARWLCLVVRRRLYVHLWHFSSSSTFGAALSAMVLSASGRRSRSALPGALLSATLPNLGHERGAFAARRSSRMHTVGVAVSITSTHKGSCVID